MDLLGIGGDAEFFNLAHLLRTGPRLNLNCSDLLSRLSESLMFDASQYLHAYQVVYLLLYITDESEEYPA